MAQLRNQALINNIAKRIKILRESTEVTQEQFFFDTGIHLGRIETGNSNITVSTLEAICAYFDLTLHEFFKGM